MHRFKKGNKFGFKPNNIPHNKGESHQGETIVTAHYKRVTEELTEIVKNPPSVAESQEMKSRTGCYKLLRPVKPSTKQASDKTDDSEIERSNEDSNRLLHLGKTSEMWNAVFKEHQTLHPSCNGHLNWDLSSEERRGLVSRFAVICSECTYKSKKFTLYKEIVEKKKRGRKPAALNYGLQVGLSQSAIGNSAIRKILLSANTPAPSSKSLQDSSNTVLKKIIEINENDMHTRRQKLIEVNELRGAENPNIIGIQCDGIYNNALYSGVGETPFQPATQTVFTIAENVTINHEIISLVTKNKICSKGQHLQSKVNSDHECSSGVCGANIPMHQNIGDEFTWVKEGMTSLAHDNLQVGHITSDPDSTIAKAGETLYQEGVLTSKPQHYFDTRHISENIRKSIKKMEPLSKIMPSSTKAGRTKLLHNFAIDVVDRCTAEVNQTISVYAGNASKIKNKLSYTIDAILGCYMGHHNFCKKHSLVCSGGIKNWVYRSAYLDNSFKIKLSPENADILRPCLLKRLAPAVLEKTIINSNTQKVESFNRRLRRSLPKNVTFSRNFAGRAHSAAHCTNNGPGNSLETLLAGVGAEIPQGGHVSKSLKALQNEYETHKMYQKSDKYKRNRVIKRKKLYKLHEVHQEQAQYRKNMMIPCLIKAGKKGVLPSPEHNYFKSFCKKYT